MLEFWTLLFIVSYTYFTPPTKASDLADCWMQTLPPQGLETILAGNTTPSTCIPKSKGIPTAKEVSAVYVWLKGLAMYVPDKVASGYFISDALLILNEKLNFNLYGKDVNQAKASFKGRYGKDGYKYPYACPR